MPRLLPLIIAGDHGSWAGKAFENAVLIARQRPGKSASPAGKVHRQCIWSGRMTQASMLKGARRRTCRTAPRSVSIRVTNGSERRSGKLTLGEERSTRDPIAAIVRHASEYASENGGICSRFSALR